MFQVCSEEQTILIKNSNFMDIKQFLSALNQIADTKGIPKDKVIETIEMAIAAAYKKDYGEKGQIIKAKLDMKTGATQIFQVKTVVDESMIKTEEEIQEEIEKKKAGIMPETQTHEEDEEVKKVVFNAERHIMLEDALKIDPNLKLGEEVAFELESKENFGRIAAQTAKQVILQRLREAEKEAVLSEFQSKEGEVLSAQAQRFERGNVIFDLGRASGIMYPEEQMPGEHYRVGSRIKVYVLRVEMTNRGPMISVSRTHPQLIRKLFELEVPEVATGVVELKSIAREAGSRSKIAVATLQDGVDPIGSCVGQKGTRVSTVISELNGEKIDIIEWSADHSKFISNALSPAKVLSVEINEAMRAAKVTVPDEQLSLAIGKGGQNVRLAAKLTGWKIDVHSATEKTEKIETEAVSAEEVPKQAEEAKEEIKAEE